MTSSLTNPILLGSLIVPLGLPLQGERPHDDSDEKRRKPPGLKLGELPLARGDVERLRQALMLQRPLAYDALKIVARGEKEDTGGLAA